MPPLGPSTGPPPGAEPFLAAIRANPDDDLVRLVYADWLDETGDPAAAVRAEFIRVQCELASLGFEGANPRRKRPETWDTQNQRIDALIHRQNELWDEHGTAWRAELPPCPGSTLWFTRGFATWVDIEHVGGMMRFGDDLVASAPITRLSFRDPPLEALTIPILKGKWFEQIRKISVAYRPHSNRHGDELLDALQTSMWTGNIRELVLPVNDVGDMGMVAISQSKFARNLIRLDLSGNRIGNYGATLLESVLDPDRLQMLDLSENPILTEYRRRLETRFPGKVRFL